MSRGLVIIEQSVPPTPPGAITPIPALAPVANRPLLEHALDWLREAGVRRIAVVVSDCVAGLAREAVAARPRARSRLEWVEVPGGLGLCEGILAAEEFLAGEPFAVHLGSGLMRAAPDHLRSALRRPEADATVLFCRRRARAPAPSAAVVARAVSGQSGVAALPETDLDLTGVHAFTPAMVDAIRDVAPGHDGRRPLIDAVDRLAARGGRIAARVVEGWYPCSEGRQDLLDANHDFLDGIESRMDGVELDECTTEGRVSVHPSAFLARSVIRGPVVIGARARVCDAYVGPYTAIGDDVVLENAEVEHSVLLPGASVRHVGIRLEGSVLGPDAAVGRDFALPRAIRCFLGAGAEVRLS